MSQTASGKSRKWIIISAAIMVPVAIAAAFLLPRLSTPLQVFQNFELLQITALSEGDGGISAGTGFRVQYMSDDVKYSEEDIKKGISVTPEIRYTVKKEGVNSFLLQPEAALEKNTVYSFATAGESSFSWAFQTEDDYKIVSTTPDSGSHHTSVDAGIEITFSHSGADLKDFFSISPKVKGKFQSYGKTTVFIPSSPLEYDTVYSVTVKNGAKNGAGKVLKEDYSFKFRTERKNSDELKFYLCNSFHETYLTSDPVVISTTGNVNQTYKINVYKLKDGNEYIELAAKFSSDSYIYLNASLAERAIDLKGRQSVMSASLNPVAGGYFILPETPAAGYYLVDIRSLNGETVQKLVQISDVSVYLQSINGQCLLWVNDAQTGKPCSNANIELTQGDYKATGTTDADGLAVIDYDPPVKEKDAVIRIESGKKKYVEVMRLYEPDEYQPIRDYYCYVYTDREAYQPNDTINYWGRLLPRREGVKLPESITLTMSGEPDSTVKINKDGTFIGKLEIKNKQSYGYSLEFSIDGARLHGKYLTAMEYQKPTYQFEASLDKKYYRAGDEMTMNITGSFYDGSPAQGLELTGSGKNNKLTLDKSGKGSFHYTAKAESYGAPSWEPQAQSRSYSVTGLDENHGNYAHTWVFPCDEMLETQWTGTDDYMQFKITTNKIDYTNADNGKYLKARDNYDYSGNRNDLVRGEKAELKGMITVNKRTATKKKTGEHYDFIQKKTVPEYEYSSEESVVKEIKFTTKNGEFTTEKFSYKNTDEVYYWFTLDCTATNGWDFQETVRESGRDRYMYGNYSNYRYELKTQSEYLTYFSEENTPELWLTDNNDKLVKGGGRLLYTVMQDRVTYKGITENGRVNIPFDESLLPDFTVCGAYFDGKHIYITTSPQFKYEKDLRELEVEIKPDKPSYRPGDNVKLEHPRR